MAGARRATGRPLRRDLQAQRARIRLDERLTADQDPIRKLRHAFDYLCSAVKHAPDGPERALAMVDEFAARGDALWREKRQ